ncbi:BQ5605_C025g10100 [Microbotryum silenes-dioicae]|uniref:BQ5605_C025g10086 protein n=1 Tax=Microbotryum silenes-dioicae TaxID=796604 RepID=A0A2X0NFC3_9BASI|nr:BQ5605_C025g10086 [Microbotryum silenes-dioicae]SGZ27270.1 BQ5605_C025g10100 [Microbotryum silenes-dioicae]
MTTEKRRRAWNQSEAVLRKVSLALVGLGVLLASSRALRASARAFGGPLTSVARTSDWNESTAADPLPSPTFGPMLSIKGAAAATKARS